MVHTEYRQVINNRCLHSIIIIRNNVFVIISAVLRINSKQSIIIEQPGVYRSGTSLINQCVSLRDNLDSLECNASGEPENPGVYCSGTSVTTPCFFRNNLNSSEYYRLGTTRTAWSIIILVQLGQPGVSVSGQPENVCTTFVCDVNGLPAVHCQAYVDAL